MQEKYKIWYLAERYADNPKDKGEITRYCFKSLTDEICYVSKRDAYTFVRNHTVVNCKCQSEHIVGYGTKLTEIPKYIKLSEGTIIRKSGVSDDELSERISHLLLVDKEIANYYRTGYDKL